MLRIKLVRSPIAFHWRERLTVQAIGLHKVGQTIEKEDTPSLRGQIHKVKHMLQVWEPGSETPVVDATKVRKWATRKSKTPPSAHSKH